MLRLWNFICERIFNFLLEKTIKHLIKTFQFSRGDGDTPNILWLVGSKRWDVTPKHMIVQLFLHLYDLYQMFNRQQLHEEGAERDSNSGFCLLE